MASTTSSRDRLRDFRRWLIVFSVISLAMGALQWLVFARGGGAKNWVYRLGERGHPRAAATLAAVNESALLRSLDRLWQRGLNAPRNHLYAALGIIDSPDALHFYGASGRVGWWPDVRDWLLFSAGTVVVYLPLLLLALWLRQRRRAARDILPP